MSERFLSDNLLEHITATVITPTWNDSISMALELRERRAVDEHRRKSDEELIARREADLTEFERVQLLSLRVNMQADPYVDVSMLALLDKLLATRSAR